MTFVGKILVVVIMVFALFFLAVSTVVFSTSKSWKDETERLKTSITGANGLNAKLKAANDEAAVRKSQLDAAQAELTKTTDAFNARIKTLNQALDARQKELTEQRTIVETAQETSKTALAQAEARTKETELLHTQLLAVTKQSDEYKIQQNDLNDQIRIQQRQLETAKKNNDDLKERVLLLSSVVRRNGLSDDIRQIKGVASAPPDVEGQVTRVDARNERLEISIGSDDGLVVGHELQVFRTKPTPEYIGHIRVIAVEPDQAVGKVIGNTLHGKKIQEGDIVAPKIRPRS
jgi:hypothetical protein